MVHIKFTARSRTPIVSPNFALMALEDAAAISTERRESSTEQPDMSLVAEEVVASTEATSEQDADSGEENPSGDTGDSGNVSDNGGHVKIGEEAARGGISYDFGR
jgi:hypothetical protein